MRGFLKSTTRILKAAAVTGALFLALGNMAPLSANAADVTGKWLSGDFHQHTTYSDGSYHFFFMAQKNYEYSLDWWANSEHGGGQTRDGEDRYWDDSSVYPKNPIQGDYAVSGGHQVMWRWQSLRDFAYADILKTRSIYSDMTIVSGLEWNVPGHEHCSTAMAGKDASAISAFEFMFDTNDHDLSRNHELTPYGVLAKRNGKTYSFSGGEKVVTGKPYPERHIDSVRAVSWMEKQYRQGLIDGGWIIWAHVERHGVWTPENGGGYNVEHFRDFNNAGPDVCFGFEGAPGHQADSPDRGGFGPDEAFGGTYGGVGFYSAKVGGLWDALLGEGRNWYNFASSDAHDHWTDGGSDFYPGEYQKTWTYVKDLDGDGKYSPKEIYTGLRSGDSFFVQGDLINALDFSAWKNPDRTVEMGGKITVPNNARPVTIRIRFKSPSTNNNGNAVKVDHIDLIAGGITGKIEPTDPNYTKATNDSTAVIARFTSEDWTVDSDGYSVITYQTPVTKSTYFRLRGTNLAVNTPNETDADGNPLADSLATANLGLDGAPEAWADLWFYSNPIFVYVK